MAEPPLPFGLRLEGGQAALSLERPVWLSYGRVERLHIRWPDVRYPFDLGEGMRALKRLRGQLREFEVVVAPGRLLEGLDEAPLAKFGISALELQVIDSGTLTGSQPPRDGTAAAKPPPSRRVDSRLRLAFRADVAGRGAEVTVPVGLTPAPGGVLRLELEVPRVYGALGLPAPLLLAGLSAAAPSGSWPAREPPLLRSRGLAGWELDVRELALFGLLAPRGWRLPERGRVELVAVEVGPDGVRLRLVEGEGGVGEAPPPEFQLIDDGDAALRAGESRPALEAYRQAAALAGDDRRAADRVLSVLVAAGDAGAMEAEARRQAASAPGAIWPALARAAAAAERGRQGESAAAYQVLAAALGARGEVYDQACALAAAAAALERAGQLHPAAAQRAAALAALDGLPRSIPGTGLRARLSAPPRRGEEAPVEEVAVEPTPVGDLSRARAAWQEGRLEEGAKLHEAVLAAAPSGDPAVSESHLRLAQWARLQGQMATASRHLTRALRGEPEAGAAADVLIEVLEAFGRTDDLVGVLRGRLEQAEPEVKRRELARALGGVLERAGRAGEAVELYRAGLDRGDDAVSLARLSEIFRREGRSADLREVLEALFTHLTEGSGGRVVDEVEAGIDLETVAVELAGLVAPGPGAAERARDILTRTLALRPDAAEARQALEALGGAPADSADDNPE